MEGRLSGMSSSKSSVQVAKKHSSFAVILRLHGTGPAGSFFDTKKWWISKVDFYALPFSLGGSLWLPLPWIEISLSEKWCNDIWSMVSGNFFLIKKQEQYLVLVSKGPFVPDLTIICLKNFHTWNSVRSTWVYLFSPPSIICFCTSILSFWKIIQFSKVRDHRHQTPRVWGSCSSARRVCWRMPWLFLNIGSSNCKSQPLSMEMLTPKKDWTYNGFGDTHL